MHPLHFLHHLEDSYRYKRLPMGINCAPEINQIKMMELLHGIDGVLIYMDDVIVFGRYQCEHDKNLNDAVNRIKNAGLKLNRDKCEFSKK